MKLLDEDGENKAVRWFLACYGGGGDKSIGTMKLHLEMSGFGGCWPKWCNTEHPSAHLTKGGAQLWIRHLFNLEAQQVAVPASLNGELNKQTLDVLNSVQYVLEVALNPPSPTQWLADRKEVIGLVCLLLANNQPPQGDKT